MTIIYPNLCYGEGCYKGTTLYCFTQGIGPNKQKFERKNVNISYQF